MILKNYKELQQIREKFKGKKIVFCTGVFDLTHAGHVLFFEDCKDLGDILVVALGGDESVKNYKRRKPIINEHMRAKLISSLKPVDFCFISRAVKENDPMYDMVNMLEHLKPEIYAVNDDGFDMPSRKKLTDEFGTKLVILKRTCPAEFDSVSTSKIIEKIKKGS